MKRSLTIIISLLAAFSASLAAFAADSDQNYYRDHGLGLRASFDLSCPTKWNILGEKMKLYGNGAGFSAGIVYFLPTSASGLFVEPGASLYYNTESSTITVAGDSYGSTITDEGSLRMTGLRIPLNIGWRYALTDRTAIRLFAGPMLDCLFTARLHSDILDPHSMLGSSGLLNRANLLLNIGAALELDRNWYIDIQGSIGLTDAARHDPTHHRNLLRLTLGYNL